MRIGIHCGAGLAGVLGEEKFIFGEFTSHFVLK
jgi:hypothetical protein